jgi:hypothetical protein
MAMAKKLKTPPVRDLIKAERKTGRFFSKNQREMIRTA